MRWQVIWEKKVSGGGGNGGCCRASRQQIIESCRSPQVCSHCRANRKGIYRGRQICSHCRVNRPRIIESSRGCDVCSQSCRSRASTRGNIVELTIRQLYGTFSIRYADGCKSAAAATKPTTLLRIALLSIIKSRVEHH